MKPLGLGRRLIINEINKKMNIKTKTLEILSGIALALNLILLAVLSYNFYLH
jgi:hypothetical protein